jgi:hypothetical protein
MVVWSWAFPNVPELPIKTAPGFPEVIVSVVSAGSAGLKVIVSWSSRFAPTVALDTVMAPAGTVIVRENVLLMVCGDVLLSVTEISTLEMPAVVGVPHILGAEFPHETPVESKFSPGGKPVTVQ